MAFEMKFPNTNVTIGGDVTVAGAVVAESLDQRFAELADRIDALTTRVAELEAAPPAPP